MRHSTQTKQQAQVDQAQFTALYTTHHRALLSYATSILCGDISAAEDAVDEAFADIWRKGEPLKQIANPAGWMRRIVRNKAVDMLRRGTGREEPQADTFFSSFEDHAPNPEQACAMHKEQRWLRDALSILSSDQREVITLCYFDGMSLSEIAAVMDCPVNTVKTRLHYARRKLHAWIEGDCAKEDLAHLTQDSMPLMAMPA